MKKSLNYFLSILIAITLGIFYLPSQASTPKPHHKSEKVTLGIYISQLFDVSLPNKSFNATFWLWSYSDDPNFRLKDNVEIMNARQSTMDINYSGEFSKRNYWDTAKYSANFIKNWDLSLFPFDKQILQLILESSNKLSPDLIFLPDKINSAIDPEILLEDWKITQFEFLSNEKTYSTNFLSPNKLSESRYSRMVINITIEREGMRKFLQYLGVTYLACFICLCIYLVPLRDVGARISLLSASLFAAVGNKILLENALPTVNSITLVDKVEIITFIFLGFTLAFILLDNLLRINKHELIAARLNRYVFLFSIVYLACANIYIFFPVL